MLRKLQLCLLALLLPLTASAAQVTSIDCHRAGSTAGCRIFLDGEVGPNDRLYLSRVHDRDTLTFQGNVLGSTGSFLGREFHAGFFPRVYHLNAIQGVKSPVLTLTAQGGLMHSAGLPSGTQVMVIDENYPLWKILGPAALQMLGFAFLANLCFYMLLWLRQRNTDGWLYPRDELRWFLGGLGAYLLLRHEVSELFVPLFWSAKNHLFAQRIALLVTVWSATVLVLNGRFSDRSCIERGRARIPVKSFARLANVALFLSLGMIATFPDLTEHSVGCLLVVQLIPYALAQVRALYEMEWRRVMKRSSLSPLFFYLGLLALPAGVLVTVLQSWLGGAGDQGALEISGWAVFLLSGLRMRSYLQSKDRSRDLAGQCRELLTEHAHVSLRLQALCNFVADEWGAARVSIISVDSETGLVLTSAGPEAIPELSRAEPRRLGPFLRRVCKQGQMLYAPVAEELGQDLQSQGLKHSSLAIPLAQDTSVRAVVCMMADEGERIPPCDASQLEMLVEALSLEILSAVAQHVAENRNSHLLDIARTADALAVENLDHWGHFHHSKEAVTRVVLGGDSIPAGPFLEQLKKSPLLGKILAAYRAETRAHWTAVASAFEFIPKDNREDFWVISPREFRTPLLRELGPERVAILLSSILERHARALAAKECYAVLGYCGVRLACGTVHLRQSSWHGSAVEIDSEEFSLLLEIRQRAHPGMILFIGNAPDLAIAGGNAFTCRARAWEEIPGRQIYSILSVTADKKEVRRMENQALEKAKGLARKAA